MPALARFGLIVLAFGLFADLLYHGSPVALPETLGNGGHLVVLVGMLFVVGGVIGQGLRARGRQHHQARRSAHAHAHR